MFYISIALSQDLRIAMSKPISVQLLKDSKSLFDVISKGSRTSEKRTMVYRSTAREGFNNGLISDIGFVRRSDNVANGRKLHETNRTANRHIYKTITATTVAVDNPQ